MNARYQHETNTDINLFDRKGPFLILSFDECWILRMTVRRGWVSFNIKVIFPSQLNYSLYNKCVALMMT